MSIVHKVFLDLQLQEFGIVSQFLPELFNVAVNLQVLNGILGVVIPEGSERHDEVESETGAFVFQTQLRLMNDGFDPARIKAFGDDFVKGISDSFQHNVLVLFGHALKADDEKCVFRLGFITYS